MMILSGMEWHGKNITVIVLFPMLQENNRWIQVLSRFILVSHTPAISLSEYGRKTIPDFLSFLSKGI
jgi:hypothetical protein